jgi:hypothetical protein
MSTLIHARISPSIRKGELRTPTHHPHLSEAYNLDDDLDVSFFGFRRSLPTHSPAPALRTTLYDHHHHHRHDQHVPLRSYTIWISISTCTSFHVYVVPLFPRRPAKASFAGHCISYGNHKSRIIRIYSKEMQDYVHSRLTRVMFDEKKTQRCGSALGICLVASPCLWPRPHPARSCSRPPFIPS